MNDCKIPGCGQGERLARLEERIESNIAAIERAHKAIKENNQATQEALKQGAATAHEETERLRDSTAAAVEKIATAVHALEQINSQVPEMKEDLKVLKERERLQFAESAKAAAVGAAGSTFVFMVLAALVRWAFQIMSGA